MIIEKFRNEGFKNNLEKIIILKCIHSDIFIVRMSFIYHLPIIIRRFL